LITTYCSNKVHIAGVANDIKSAYEAINKHKPELVLLDIRLPDGTSFDLLKNLDEINFNIIFTTAYSDYAIDAFKFSATHYLLKPIDPVELTLAIDKAESEIRNHYLNAKIDALMFNLQQGTSIEKKIVIPTHKDIFIVQASEIVLCASDRNTTDLYFADGRLVQVSKTIKEYEEILAYYGFFRAHRQYLINIKHIKSIDKTGQGKVRLTGDIEIPLATRKKEELIKIINKL
jgi:two-component system LytT family response regulator